MLTLYFLLILGFRQSDGHYDRPDRQEDQVVGPYGETRRILRGVNITDTRPYMVYLRAALTKDPTSAQIDPNWLCGGVIIHPRYILTSAACIEDVGQFYVVSGTHKWVPANETNECITRGASRAVWKCVPKTYVYDGTAFNNIRWMVNDIAVVMVENEFNFNKRVKGCDFIPQSVAYNNQSKTLENPGNLGTIAGWGSTDQYTDPTELNTRDVAFLFQPIELNSRRVNSPNLMEAEVLVVKKSSCKKLWLPRYHSIIDKYMICGKNIPADDLSPKCDDKVECRQLVFSEEHEDVTLLRRRNKYSDRHILRSLAKFNKKRKLRKMRKMRKSGQHSYSVVRGAKYGGFCENDHGGPLIVGHGKASTVVGIISAYRNINNSKSCAGPFLYASVWNNRHLINCAIFKRTGKTCTTMLRSSATVLDEEHLDWSDQDHDRETKSKKEEKTKSKKEEETKSKKEKENKSKKEAETTRKNRHRRKKSERKHHHTPDDTTVSSTVNGFIIGADVTRTVDQRGRDSTELKSDET